MIIRPLVAYPLLILATITGFAIGGSVTRQTTVNNTLKMCNQKPLECKFKYDMVMYQETGRVPYTQSQKSTNGKN